MSNPILVQLYWGGEISYKNGVILCDNNCRSTTIIIPQQISYQEFTDLVYLHLQVQKQFYNLKFKLYYTFQGFYNISEIFNDQSLQVLYYLAANEGNFRPNIHVSIVPIMSVQQSSCMDLLRGFSAPQLASQQTLFSHEGNSYMSQFEAGPSTNTNLDDNEDDDDEVAPESSEESEAAPQSTTEDEADDEDDITDREIPQQYNYINNSESTQLVVNYSNDHEELRDYEAADFDDDDHMDMWNEESKQIRLGMYFTTKKELDHAVRLWNLERNREMIITASKGHRWRAKCYTTNPRCNINLLNGPPCKWFVYATKKSSNHMWRIVKWVDSHNCYGTVVGNNNRSLKSRDIALRIIHNIREDIAYPVKQIQAHLKDQLNVDVGYSKAWRARREAIERVYGSWVSNFQELPQYITALKSSNDKTVVEWLHHPASSSQCYTFKYVFWAFGPAIRAFQHCQPVLSVDGTHLKGSYRGKMLIAVTKNANNYIVPLAYAIVDEETVESWSWFFQQLWIHIVIQRGRKLCVISDRHKGIINAMKNLQVWRENAVHRFCLRHVRSNLMQKFKVSSLKRLCWDIGSTTQQRKYEHSVSLMTDINPDAWEYLKAIKESKWTLLHDKNHRRWGNLTTNISESFNNALRGVRLMPIKAIIDCTFNKAVEQFRKNTEIVENCQTPLPPRIWRMFLSHEIRAQEHVVTEFDYRHGRYWALSKLQTNEAGGNYYTIEYTKKTCTCGKWQIERLPCSHAIAVCRHRGDPLENIVNEFYTMAAYRAQYDSEFYPLAHSAYWTDPGWKIKPDSSKITTSRGRRKSRRIHNEMDAHYPEERGPRRCSRCRQTCHRINNCSQLHP